MNHKLKNIKSPIFSRLFFYLFPCNPTFPIPLMQFQILRIPQMQSQILTVQSPSCFTNYPLSNSIGKPQFLFSASRFKIKPYPPLALRSRSRFGSARPAAAAATKTTGFVSDSRQPSIEESPSEWNVQVGSPKIVPSSPVAKLSLSDQAFFLLAFIACTTSVAFTSLVVAAVPTLCAMGRAATSLSKLADTAREELPSTMAAIRLSGMEISDLTLELSDLSQEIADGVNKSAQAVQAAEAGIRQIGSVAREQTIWAAEKTSRAVGQATKTFINMISRGEFSPENEDETGIDRVEL
ncbi:uncharacterized protein LOC104415322 isoform X2 [Eucalyptus grandis]|uniref:uncharacterized protein LOC104415322 isoform X2 n=1 Tax=Eucalyptus grandis TaxID=71139 RepID=UPI00192F047F|nr:uncharacterized protein LOC104415322 isoform X2 [Eucalyptus grandis]